MLTAIEFWAVEDTRVIEFKLPASGIRTETAIEFSVSASSI